MLAFSLAPWLYGATAWIILVVALVVALFAPEGLGWMFFVVGLGLAVVSSGPNWAHDVVTKAAEELGYEVISADSSHVAWVDGDLICRARADIISGDEVIFSGMTCAPRISD